VQTDSPVASVHHVADASSKPQLDRREPPMKLKQIAWIGIAVLAVAGATAAWSYYVATKDPAPIRIDARIYDDYAGYYILPNGYSVTIRREGDRLMTSVPEHMPKELFPETETQFFLKGNPARWIFHRNEKGNVDYAISRWKNMEEKAEKHATLPINPAGTNGLIAATTAGQALQAGLEILKEGGSAADAAITTALCEVVHVGGSYVSFAGPFMMVYYDAKSRRVYYLNGEYATPLQEKDARSIPSRGGRTALVPGFMAGVQAAHDRFGKLPLKRLFEPAIAMADAGEPIEPVMEWWIDSKKSVLSRYPETKKIFTRPDGKFLVKGDLFRQPELAETLRKVAGQGAAYIYTGDWGRKFVAVIQREGGKITLEDMKRYRAIWEEPLRTTYREYTVYTPPAWGGVNMIQALNLLECANLKQYGPSTTSPQSLFCLMEISACQGLRRELLPETLLSKTNAAQIWNQIANRTWRGLPKSMQKTAANSPHTDGLIVVDQWGNMAVVNHTINSMLWGKTGLFVDGISIPDSASFQGEDIAKAGPGNRLPVGMCPLIVCLDGKPFLGSAATGGGLHAKTLQMLANILDFGMDPQTAVDMPTFVGWGAGQVEANMFDEKVLDGLRDMGLKIEIISSKQAGISRGYWAGVQIDPATGRMKGGVSRGLEGGVAGY
jgi:gamma-glutamyltranspeptidase/glutathione hydrolase